MQNDYIRQPDTVKKERLIGNYQDEDFEFQNAIEQSQRDFWIWRERLEKEDNERQRLKQDLPFPLSRLRLWQKTSTHPLETFFLHFIIRRVNHCLFNDWETLPILPPEHKHSFHQFLDHHIKPSSLYNKDIYRICENYESPCYLFLL